MKVHIGIDGFVSDTAGKSGRGGKYGTSDTGGRSEDCMTDEEEITIKEEPLTEDIETKDEEITTKEPIVDYMKTEEEEITIKEEPIDLAGCM